MYTAISIIATVTLMLFINALFVAAEFAALRTRKTRINQLAEAGAGRPGFFCP